MSEETTPKITTVKKEKDPKRVEAGKRLAAISKDARERKMRQRIESERKIDEESWNINYGLLFGTVGVVVAIGSLYYARRDDIRQTKKLEMIKEEPEVKNVNIQKDGSSNELDNL